jgi:hypothetical protein
MADVAQIPYQPVANPYGNIVGNINTAANTAQTQAQTQLTSQQAQQQAMNTQVQRASMPLIMQALNEANADQSSSNPGAPSQAPTTPGAQNPGQQAAQGDQSGSWYNADSLEDTLRKKNYVTPYTPQELQMLKTGTALSMNPNNPQAGKALVDRMQTQRQARIDTQTAQNQLLMGNTYDAATAVATKGKGAYQSLAAVDPADAAAIAKDTTDASGNFDEDAADTKATQYASHLAAVSHLYSGRPTDMNNGQLVDTKTGQAVTGRDQLFTGLDAKGRQAEWDKAVEPVKWTTPDNVEHQDERWRAPTAYGGYGGKLTPSQAVLAADQAARHTPNNAAQDPGIIPNAAAGQGPAAGGLDAPTHGAVAAVRVNAKNNRPAPTTGADIAASKAPATGADTGILPGVNPAALPKVVSPVSGQSAGSGGTIGTATQTALAARQNQEIENAKTAGTDAQTMRSQITQAKAEIPKIDPRTVGPGSTLYNGMLKAYTAAAGSAPDSLIDENVLDKFLNQIGASNVRNLLSGQRITNQEMMTFLTRGSPSTAMPLGGITHLLNYLDADNEYTLRYNRTKMMALKSGADPDLVDSALSNDQQGGVSRSRFVSGKTGSSDKIGGAPPSGNTATQVNTAADYAKLPPGTSYRDPQGNVRTKPKAQ